MMGLDLQPDLCSLLIDDVIYHEAAVRQAGAEALSQAVARYQRQAAEVMGRLMEIYQDKLYVSSLCTRKWSEWCECGLDSAQPLTCSRRESGSLQWWLRVAVMTAASHPGGWPARPGWEEHRSSFVNLSVAAATPGAGCFGTSYLRIASRSVGSQV